MYIPGQIQCVSFQQKKRLAIGKGGAILLDNEEQYKLLKRMRHDGRDSSKPVTQEHPEDLVMGYHMYMSPDEATRGLLLLNQMNSNYTPGSYNDYPDMTKFKCLKEFSL
jgi:dTDP-4-amino-4,6-dideoxygalactose transaminase